MKISFNHKSAFRPYDQTKSRQCFGRSLNGQLGLSETFYMFVDMARDTPGSPISRSRDLGAGGATATLTSSTYHTSSSEATLHERALQQKILEVM